MKNTCCPEPVGYVKSTFKEPVFDEKNVFINFFY
jgi:hypothetical protein